MISELTNEFISISDAITKYKVSSNKIRKLVKENIDTKHIKKVAINGKHGFKYLVSIAFLNDMFTVVNNAEIRLKQERDELKTTIKQEINSDNQNKGTDNQKDNRFIKQLQETNKQQSDTIKSQQTTIKDLTTTLQEQQKVVIAQSLQISRISEPVRSSKNVNRDQDTKKTTTIELTIIVVLVVCIVIAIVYLFK